METSLLSAAEQEEAKTINKHVLGSIDGGAASCNCLSRIEALQDIDRSVWFISGMFAADRSAQQASFQFFTVPNIELHYQNFFQDIISAS
jgi:hypothetical protein